MSVPCLSPSQLGLMPIRHPVSQGNIPIVVVLVSEDDLGLYLAADGTHLGRVNPGKPRTYYQYVVSIGSF